MTSFGFAITGAQPAPDMASPAISFRVLVEHHGPGRVHAIALRCLCRIEARRRRYTEQEQARLYELFGVPSQWERTLQSVTLAHSSLVVPSFDDHIETTLLVGCTYDLHVAAAKYLYSVRDGDIPLVFLFSGTAFCIHDSLRVEPIPWDLEASFRMPAAVWHDTMNRFFPGGGWIRLQQDTLDRLQAFRGRHVTVTWDDTIDRLLEASTEPAR